MDGGYSHVQFSFLSPTSLVVYYRLGGDSNEKPRVVIYERRDTDDSVTWDEVFAAPFPPYLSILSVEAPSYLSEPRLVFALWGTEDDVRFIGYMPLSNLGPMKRVMSDVAELGIELLVEEWQDLATFALAPLTSHPRSKVNNFYGLTSVTLNLKGDSIRSASELKEQGHHHDSLKDLLVYVAPRKRFRQINAPVVRLDLVFRPATQPSLLTLRT